MADQLTNYIKYCLGYIKLTRQRSFLAQQKQAVGLEKQYLDLIGLLNGDIDGNAGERVNLETFYSLDPKEVTEDTAEAYEKEKALAIKIEEVASKFQNDQFTKQIVLNFGYFELEMPVDSESETTDEGATPKQPVPKNTIERYPLFSIPIIIQKEQKRGHKEYVLYPVDPEIQTNTSALEPILGEDLYYQLVEELGKYEMDGKFSLPIMSLDIFTEVWHQVKSQLKLKKANFDEKSFNLDEALITLSPKTNYFLAEDLRKLTELPEEELQGTSLVSWVSDNELNLESPTPEENELYFPFKYDKYKLKTLSLLGNKASIIQGPPGTGKSETISNLLCHLAAKGNKVLFVSQKSQALKVVKDKLKKLDVQYLFGYIPNPASKQLTAEDEIDGIGPQLAALATHIEKIGYRQTVLHTPKESAVQLKGKKISEFQIEIDRQRKMYELYQTLSAHHQYELVIEDPILFEKNFNEEKLTNIVSLEGKLHKLSVSITAYSNSSEKLGFDQFFKNLDLRKEEHAAALELIRQDVERTGYDGHSQFGRAVNTLLRNLRIGKYKATLPREVRDYFDKVVSKDYSKNEQLLHLHALLLYLNYFAEINQQQATSFGLDQLKKEIGLTASQHEKLVVLLQSTKEDLRGVKQKILLAYNVSQELEALKLANSDLNQLYSEIGAADDDRRSRVILYIQNSINARLLQKWLEITIRRLAIKLSKAFAKSKKAYKTFDRLRNDPSNFNAILDLIPVWIMELDDASRIIPLEAGMFDYVILDEASQCNVAYTLPVMFRAKHTIFVGDSEQMRDSTVMFKSNKFFAELASRYQIPDELQIKAFGTAVQSVLEIAKFRAFRSVPLRYHYRSPQELIGFSNNFFYRPKGLDLISLNSTYLTYKDTNRIMLVHQLDTAIGQEVSDNMNIAEAMAILEMFKDLRSDPRYKEKSVGILSFFNDQAACIRKFFEDAGFDEDADNYKVSIIEGIQGDEKDIILYSFVIRNRDQKNKYLPLTGEGGDIQGDVNRGRVNVAFSRAKQQVHCFVSMPISTIPDGIWIKKYLEYVEENGQITPSLVDETKFDSNFEREFYHLIRPKLKSSVIQNQVGSCGFKIDFVVSNTKTGKRLAIECDGPMHFADEVDEAFGINIESDIERQMVLESAGWVFYRVKYSDWVDPDFDRERIILDIKNHLN